MPYFLSDSIAPTRPQWRVFTQATLCFLQDREGASPFQSEALVSGKGGREGGSLDEEALSGQALFCPLVPQGSLPFS